MISKAFKKTIKDTLKKEYGVDCNRMIVYPHQDNYQQDYTLHCSDGKFKSVLRLTLHSGIQADNKYTNCFYVFAEELNMECSPVLIEKSFPTIVIDAMEEVRSLFSYLNPYYSYMLEHSKICLIFGHFNTSDKGIDIKDILIRIETTSTIKFYNSLDVVKVCAYLSMIGNEILIKPVKNYCKDTFFQVPVILEPTTIDVFKSNYAKSLLFFMNDRYKSTYNDKEEDYMHLNYEDLKRYLLVHTMEKI